MLLFLRGFFFLFRKTFRYEKSGHLIGKEYFLHAYGPIYVLSAEVVASIAIARNNRFIILVFTSGALYIFGTC